MLHLLNRRDSLLGALIVLLLPAAAFGQEAWKRPPLEADPQDLLSAFKALPQDPENPAVTLLTECRWRFEADGRAESRVRTIYQVLLQDAVQDYGVVSAGWSPWYQERPTIRCRVITPDGMAHPLNIDTLTEKSVPSQNADIFTDRKMLTGPLPSMRAGAIVEIEIVTRHTKPFFDRGIVEYQHFGSGIPVHHQILVLDSPENLSLKHRIHLLPELKTTSEAAAGRIVTRFESGPLLKREPIEPYMPSEVPTGPQIVFCTGIDWNQVARRYHEIVETQIADSLLEPLGELPGKDLPTKERITRVLSAIHGKVRYTSLALGEASIVPRPPAETLKRGYGDCKDKAALLVAALRKLGIEAHVAVLLTGPGADIEAELPGFGAFDHAIVRVATDPPMWIDATDPLSHPGSLPIQDQDRLSLIAAPSTQALTRTPAASPQDNQDVKIREFRLADFGPAGLKEIRRPTGALERSMRGVLDQERKLVDKNLENYIKAVFAAEKLVRSDYTSPNDLTKPLEITVEAGGAGRGQTDLREAVVAVPVANLLAELPWVLRNDPSEDEDEKKEKDSKKPWRKHDIVLSVPYVMEWRYRLIPPPGFKPRPLPATESVMMGPANLRKEFKANEDGSISATFRFDCGRRRMTPAEGLELRQAAVRLQQEEMILIGFVQSGTAHLEGGRIREALAEYRQLSAQAPEKSLHHVQIARALLVAGLGDAARREARKAVGMDAASLIAQQTLGWVLEHDLIGRRFEQGWDPQGAAEAYRAALKTQPGHLESALELAILLEHDSDGQRYTSESRLKEAIDTYKSVAKQIEGSKFESNLLLAILWTGDFAELRSRLKKPTTVAGQLCLAVALAALEGSEAALAYCARSIPVQETRQKVMAEAGEILIKLRYYPEGAAFLTAAARGAENAANLLARADRFQKAKRFDAAPAETEDPADLVKRFQYLLMAPKPDYEVMKRLMSRTTILDPDQTWDKAIDDMRGGIRKIFQRQGMPASVGADLMLSLVEPDSEGEKAYGFRVRIPPAFSGNTQLWYVIPEGPSLRLVLPASGVIGRIALDLLAAGKTDHALKWLAWAAEENDAPDRETPESNPFSVLWKKRKESDVTGLKIVAAALAAEGPGCEAALQILENARQTAGIEPKQAYVLDHALYIANTTLKKYPEALAAVRRMVEGEPDAEIVNYYLLRSLERLEKFDEAIALCQEKLKRKPNDLDSLHLLQHIKMKQGQFAESIEIGRRILKSGKPDFTALNNLAWTELLEGKALDKALQDAQRAVQQSQGQRDHILHTLATVYAEMGRPVEARNVLLQTFRSRSNQEPQDHDWFVLGRIAEEYGAIESAVEAYRKTAKAPEADSPQSTNQLSLRRLRLMAEREKK